MAARPAERAGSAGWPCRPAGPRRRGRPGRRVVALGVQRVGGDHDANEVQAVKQRLDSAISLVAAGTSRWASTAPSWWSSAAGRCTWWPSRVEPRNVLPSTATAGRRRGPGGRSRSASHAPIARSNRSPSTRASTRRMVASPGAWQRRVSGSRRTPSAARTGPGASVAHSAIAATLRAPASTAAALTPSTLARVCAVPAGHAGQGSAPAVPAGQAIRPERADGHGQSR
jgi:hypothetical protein